MPPSGRPQARPTVAHAVRISIRGTVQGVGFRPFVYRLACRRRLTGWVLNGERGVEIHVEGAARAVDEFLLALRAEAPPAARIAALEIAPAEAAGYDTFVIGESRRQDHPTVRISPDLPVCAACLAELADAGDRRYGYPYINCTNCGPRYTIIRDLPYDRSRTTMRDWPMCPECGREYHDPGDRRFHAQPAACPRCGPNYVMPTRDGVTARGEDAIRKAAWSIAHGSIVALKGLGGYHLACDACDPAAVEALRRRKYRKEKPFALMVRDLDTARSIAEISDDAAVLLESVARPIVLCPALAPLRGVAPDNDELGLMLPSTPLHDLLYAAGAPPVMVMTSANRSNEPIAYLDADALTRLDGIADVFLIGERLIQRRVDDSVVRPGRRGPVMLRRARGYAPEAVAVLPVRRPILAVGADLKNTVTLVVDGQAFMSQHLGDLEQAQARLAFRETIADFCRMYQVSMDDLLVASDLHPEYASTIEAGMLPGEHLSVQHHEAHIASVLAERSAWDRRIVGAAFDGTGYGPDGAIWGGEVFAGSLAEGFVRMVHLRSAALPGGDAAARFPVQAAAGFLAQIDHLPDLEAPPFAFPPRYRHARELARNGIRTFPTTSVGRLFDTAAALLGFVREISFEGQAAIWLEHVARRSDPVEGYAFPMDGGELDFRPLLEAVIADRVAGRTIPEIARAFHTAVARGLWDAVLGCCEVSGAGAVVLSGGVFQNALLLALIDDLTSHRHDSPELWLNRLVPPNDGGISLGQAALAVWSPRAGALVKIAEHQPRESAS
jgi:hydrogenase maturation protein HypF